MKKNYFLLAATTMMFAACAQTDLVNEVVTEETPQAIEFETFANKQTRAVENNEDADYVENDLSNHHESFLVWGYKNTDATDKVFDGVTVNWKNSSSVWDYVDQEEGVTPVYWDKAATSYDFYAVAPAKESFWTLNANTADQDDDYITTSKFTVTTHNYNTLSYTTGATSSFKDITDAEDLMIAAKNRVSKAVGDVPNSVSLDFTHILSRLNVTVKASISGVKVQSIVIGNIDANGTFNEVPTKTVDGVKTDILADGDLEAGTTLRWNTDNDNAVSYTFPGIDLELSTTTPYYAIQSLLIPQIVSLESVAVNTTDFTSVNHPYLYIQYTINGEPYTQAHNLAAAFGAKADDSDPTTDEYQTVAFNEGWQNTLNLEIGGDLIVFTGNVASWTDASTGGTTIE